MKQNNNSFYRLIINISKPLIYLLYRPKYYGKEYLDFDGPAIIASNHIHMPDPLFIMTGTARVVRYLSKKELNDSLLGFDYNGMKTIRVDRGQNNSSTMKEAEKALRNGDVIGIFPEGTRNRNNPDELLPFKFGAVKMAKETGSMIIPIALKSKGFPFINKYSINIGKPYSIMENADLEAENNRLRAIIQSLYDEI